MPIRSKKEIYQLLEKYLRETDTPLTCTTLMDKADVRKVALEELSDDLTRATEKLSDALGLLWRKGLVRRFPATDNTMARFSYKWIDKEPAQKPVQPLVLKKKTGLIVQEHEDGVMIEFEKFIVFIKPK